MSKNKLLIIDDDLDTCQFLTDFLKNEGYEAGFILNGLQLIKKLEIDKPDLLIMDIKMSWISGLELCKAVKTSSEFADIPVIFISVLGDEKTKKEALDVGASAFLKKPIDLKLLLKTIRKVLKDEK